MRDIKFRQPIYDVKGKFKEFHYWGIFGGVFSNPLPILESEQFTGLFDSSGKEIWEGDLILAEDVDFGIAKENRAGVVVYENNAFQLRMFVSGNEVLLPFWTNAEIISNAGSKHEDPELDPFAEQ